MHETQKEFHCLARMAAEAGLASNASTRERTVVMHLFLVPWASRREAWVPQVARSERRPVVGASRRAPKYLAPSWAQVRPKGLCLMASRQRWCSCWGTTTDLTVH